jgi:hypothetical protein
MAIKLITFKTNQTLIGSVTDNDDFETVTIREPVQVVVVPPRSQTDQGGIAFSPYLEYSSEFKTGIKLNKSDILCINTPLVELENQYNQIFGSGIQIASTLV